MTSNSSRDETHECSRETIRSNRRNPAEVICIRCTKRFPCEHFGLLPQLRRPREFAQIIILSSTSLIEPVCTLEHWNDTTQEWVRGTVCHGMVVFTHQGWTFNSKCSACGQSYLNVQARHIYDSIDKIKV